MRISDWSSDVCSSDLARRILDQRPMPLAAILFRPFVELLGHEEGVVGDGHHTLARCRLLGHKHRDREVIKNDTLHAGFLETLTMAGFDVRLARLLGSFGLDPPPTGLRGDEEDRHRRISGVEWDYANAMHLTPLVRGDSNPPCGGGNDEAWWARQDSNLRQRRYERRVLTAELRSEEHTTELQSLMPTPNADFCLK